MRIKKVYADDGEVAGSAMIACQIRLTLGPDTKWEADRIANIVAAKLKQHEQDGFRYVRFLFDYESGSYEGIAFWDATGEYVESLIPEYLTLLNEMTKYGQQWTPVVELFEVYFPKAIQIDFNCDS